MFPEGTAPAGPSQCLLMMPDFLDTGTPEKGRLGRGASFLRSASEDARISDDAKMAEELQKKEYEQDPGKIDKSTVGEVGGEADEQSADMLYRVAHFPHSSPNSQMATHLPAESLDLAQSQVITTKYRMIDPKVDIYRENSNSMHASCFFFSSHVVSPDEDDPSQTCRDHREREHHKERWEEAEEVSSPEG